MQVPSGRTFDTATDLVILKEMAAYWFIRYSDTPFKLKSGIMSNVYIFGREDLTDNPNLEWLIGAKIARHLQDVVDPSKQTCLIGIPTAGTALAQAASMVSYCQEIYSGTGPFCHRIMREALKQHGAHQTWVNGKPDHARHSYWVVDNVATDGQSKFEAEEKLRQDGYETSEVRCLIFVDRQQGAVQRIRDKTPFKRVEVVYSLLDLTFAFGELGLWPKSAVVAVEKEIKEHQLI